MKRKYRIDPQKSELNQFTASQLTNSRHKMSTDKPILQYVQWKSLVSPDFWYKLAEVKLDIERLEESEKEIKCTFSNYEGRNCLMEIDCAAFNK